MEQSEVDVWRRQMKQRCVERDEREIEVPVVVVRKLLLDYFNQFGIPDENFRVLRGGEPIEGHFKLVWFYEKELDTTPMEKEDA